MTAPPTELGEQPRESRRASTPRRLRAVSPWRRRNREEDDGEESSSTTKRQATPHRQRASSRGRQRSVSAKKERSSSRGRPALERRPSLRQSARSLLQRASSFGSLVRSASSRSLKGDNDDDDNEEDEDQREWKALLRQINNHIAKLQKRADALKKQLHEAKSCAMSHYATRRKHEQPAAYNAMRQADKHKNNLGHVTIALAGLQDLRNQIQDAIQHECYTTSPTMKRQKMGGILANLEYNQGQYEPLTDKQARKELKQSFQEENWDYYLKRTKQ